VEKDVARLIHNEIWLTHNFTTFKVNYSIHQGCIIVLSLLPRALPVDLARRGGLAVMAEAMARCPGEVAVVSSFGADSALLLALVAEIDPATPVLFLDTGKHFPETLSYRLHLEQHLGLTDMRAIHPAPAQLARRDPTGGLHLVIPDDCCEIRKIGPLEQALSAFPIWISGRRRDQASTRKAIAWVEQDGARTKLNPLADWTHEEVKRAAAQLRLPAHPLEAMGYPSIGCAPCTRAVAPGEDRRAGRWSGTGKTECGIHRQRIR